MLTGEAGGIGLIKLFELNGAHRLVNLATRRPIGTGDGVLIGRLVITGDEPLIVVLRAISPSLAAHGVEGVLENSHLTLYCGLTVIDANGDWGDHTNADSLPAQFVRFDPAKAAILVSGERSSTGPTLLEVHERWATAPFSPLHPHCAATPPSGTLAARKRGNVEWLSLRA
tara:strand:+ start:731 stop:1243 length:513 start_codon:yes stop_codon:yes gene_type:complete